MPSRPRCRAGSTSSFSTRPAAFRRIADSIRQAKEFKGTVDVDHIALTKLDGTAKGGVVLGIAQEVGIPVRYVGIGEALGDLVDFEAESFVEALFAEDGQS